MKRTFFFALAAAMVALMSSCSTQYNLTDSQTNLLPVSSMAYTLPTVAELQVNESKVTFQMDFRNNMQLKDISDFSSSPKVQYMIKVALTKAAEKYAADIIVAPNYAIATSEDYRTITVTVTGYPATYTKFHTATPADMELLQKNTKASAVIPCTSSSIHNSEWSEFYAQ